MQYFLKDLWNFENSVNILTRIPPNYYQNISKNKRNIWTHPYNILFFISENLKFENVRNVWKVYAPFFRVYISRSYYFVFKKWVYISEIILWRWGSEMINFPLIKSTKAWRWISYLSKNMKWKLKTFPFSSKGITQH